MSYNKVILLGNLTRDVELKFTTGGKAVARIGLALSHKYKKGDEWVEETTFVDVELWGRTAEIAGEYLKKGSQCMIEGRLKMDTWDDKQTGQKRSKLLVTGESLHLLGQREATSRPPATTPAKPASKPPTKRDPDLDDPDSSIPF